MSTNKYNQKYRISSTRLAKWDYASPGYYFVTICMNNKSKEFGEIVDSSMKYSDIGKYAQQCWNNFPIHFTNVELDTFSIMPDHIHGILVIHRKQSSCRDGACPVSTTLGNVIGSFKSAVTKYANSHKIEFHWQARFFDHVIRNERSLYEIRQYIADNQKNWMKEEI